MVKITIVIGTRPEVIKMAPVVRALAANPTLFDVELCVVTQQQQLLDQALDEWKLTPDCRIELEDCKLRLAPKLAAMLVGLEQHILASQPDIVLVHGDTTTTLGASLAAFYAGVPLGHVEAGLRTDNLWRPFPEEMHRVVVDRLASVHYAPTERARLNLLAAGCSETSIVVVGNTIVDALRIARASRNPKLDEGEACKERKLLLVTSHRRENFGDPSRAVCEALRSVVQAHPDLEVTYVLHPHPAARDPVRMILENVERVQLVEPLSYCAFLELLDRSFLVITDSGGIQEEAICLGKPVLVTRQETERIELVELGVGQLVGSSPDTIIRLINTMLENPQAHCPMPPDTYPFGDGHAADRIRDDLSTRLLR